MTSKECNEFLAMRRRIAKHGSPEYSVGHRRMYSSTVELLRGKECSILEAGFGIGYGLSMMDARLKMSRYIGFEPCQDSFNYVKEEVVPKLQQKDRIKLSQNKWPCRIEPVDYAFCIEVIEHVPEEGGLVESFLEGLRSCTLKNLFLSTPCSSSSPHGVRTVKQWKHALKKAGFSVVSVSHQWTTLYIAE